MKKITFGLIVIVLVTLFLLFGCTQSPVCGNGICESGEDYLICLSDCENELICSDSDGGLDYFVKGYVIVPEGEIMDSCEIHTGSIAYSVDSCEGSECYIYEANCNEYPPTYVSTDHACPNGCFNGACIFNENTCGDGSCNGNETSESCPQDCKIVQDDFNELKIALIMIKYQDMNRPPPTLESLKQVGDNIKEFWNEDSYSKIIVSDVNFYGWYTFPSNCQKMTFLSDEELNDLTNNEINLEEYNRIGFVYFNDCVGGGNGGGERFLVGFNERTLENKFNSLNWNNLDSVINHELGHTFGFSHSSLLMCDKNVLQGNCVVDSYGNNYDLMGAGGLVNLVSDNVRYETMMHTNALQKNKAGFLNDDNILDIIADGTYKIGSLHNGSNKYRAARFYVDGAEYYIEWRKSTGFDSGILDPQTVNVTQGLLVNRTTNINLAPESLLLNFNRIGNYPVLSLGRGETFKEDSAGFTLKVNEIYESEIEFSINFVESNCIPTNLLAYATSYNQSQNEDMILINYIIYFTSIESKQCENMTLTTSVTDDINFSSNLICAEPTIDGVFFWHGVENQTIIPNNIYYLSGTIQVPINSNYFGQHIYINLEHNGIITKIPIYVYEPN